MDLDLNASSSAYLLYDLQRQFKRFAHSGSGGGRNGAEGGAEPMEALELGWPLGIASLFVSYPGKGPYLCFIVLGFELPQGWGPVTSE